MRIPGIVALCAALAARHRLRILLQHTCRQSPVTARSEAQAVSTRAATLSDVRDSQRKDQWTTAAAVVVSGQPRSSSRATSKTRPSSLK